MGENSIAVTAEFGQMTKPDQFDEVEQSIHRITGKWNFRVGAITGCHSRYADEGNFL